MITQKGYIANLLKRFRISDAKSVCIPLEPKSKVTETEHDRMIKRDLSISRTYRFLNVSAPDPISPTR